MQNGISFSLYFSGLQVIEHFLYMCLVYMFYIFIYSCLLLCELFVFLLHIFKTGVFSFQIDIIWIPIYIRLSVLHIPFLTVLSFFFGNDRFYS